MMQALPGDAAFRIAAGRYGYDMMDAMAAEAVRIELGLDRHFLVQLRDWLWALGRLNLGESFVYGGPVSEKIAPQLKFSLLLAAGAIVTSLLFALPIGIAAGLAPGGIVDRVSLAVSILLRAVPAFALGIALVLVFSVQLKLFPVAGFRGFSYLVLPSLTLGLGLAAVSNRVVRDAVVEAMSTEWHLFARTIRTVIKCNLATSRTAKRLITRGHLCWSPNGLPS